MNYIEIAKNQAAQIILAAARKNSQAEVKPPVIEEPKDIAHGDFATGFAMQNAKQMGGNPRQIAQSLVENLDFSGTYFVSAEIAGPGFINLRLGRQWFYDVVENIIGEGDNYGRTTAQSPEKIMVEYVSANPTGPMHMGNARGGVVGDSIAEALRWAGHDVWREFYVNDEGNQIEKFAQSLSARYMQIILGEDNYPFPEDGYQGEDIKDLASAFYGKHGDIYKDDPAGLGKAIAEYGLSVNIPKMKRDLARYNIKYDQWFYESTLHQSSEVEDTVQKLIESGVTYEQDGALWLKCTDFGCEKDDVLRRANGFYTYFAADIAYHRNKLETRGFNRAINVWGADHHGHILRMKKALDAMGLDGTNRLEIVIIQMVKIFQDGKVARMSKRTGKAITLSDLLEDIPVDAARFFFNNRAPSSHLDFDLDLAVRQDSENPVYYVQYAHARICSIMKALRQDGISTDVKNPDLTLLAAPAEIALIRELSKLPEEIVQAANSRETSRLNRYAAAVATAFHRFYTDCRIRDAGSDALRDARIALGGCAATVIKNTLSIFGVSAPEHM